MVCAMKINFLLDSSSTAKLLSSAEYRKLPPELSPGLQPTNMSVEDLNGHALLVHGIGQFQVCLEDVPHKATLLVVDMDLPAILGQDFLLEFVDHINYKTKLLHTERATKKFSVGQLMIIQLQKSRSREQFPYLPIMVSLFQFLWQMAVISQRLVFLNNSLHLMMKSKFLTD